MFISIFLLLNVFILKFTQIYFFKYSSIYLANGYFFLTKFSQNIARRRYISYIGRLEDLKLDKEFYINFNKDYYDQFNFDYERYINSAFRHRGILVPIKNLEGEWVWFPITHNPYDFNSDIDDRIILPFYKSIPELYEHDLININYIPRYINVKGFHAKVKDVTKDNTKVLKMVPEAKSDKIISENLEQVGELLDEFNLVKDLNLNDITPVECNTILTKGEIQNYFLDINNI